MVRNILRLFLRDDRALYIFLEIMPQEKESLLFMVFKRKDGGGA